MSASAAIYESGLGSPINGWYFTALTGTFFLQTETKIEPDLRLWEDEMAKPLPQKHSQKGQND